MTDTTTRRDWYDTHGYLYLSLELEDAQYGAQQGQCEGYIADLLTVPYIAEQVADWDAATLADVLREYGAWDAEELADHEANRARMLWLACNDVREEEFLREDTAA